MKKALFLVLVLILISASPALAAAEGEEIPSFDKALEQASGPLIAVIVGLLISLLIDNPEYNELSTAQKRLVYGCLCLILPLGAASLRALLNYVPWSFDPLLWHALWHGVAAALTGTALHMKVKAVK